jgi:hypothetical protein
LPNCLRFSKPSSLRLASFAATAAEDILFVIVVLKVGVVRGVVV